MTPPKNLTEMILFIELRKNIAMEYDNKAKEFTLISDNVKILGKIFCRSKFQWNKKKIFIILIVF